MSAADLFAAIAAQRAGLSVKHQCFTDKHAGQGGCLRPHQPLEPCHADDMATKATNLCECGCGQYAANRFVRGHHLWPGWKPAYVVTETGCWEWQRYCDSNGYGRAYDGTRMDWAHRVFYVAAKGPIPAGLELDHLCSNPPCVNPDHLEPVTSVENMRRAFERRGFDRRHLTAGRLRSDGLTFDEIAQVLEYSGKSAAASAVKSAITKGLVSADDMPPSVELTEAERDEIRDLYALGVPQKELARWYAIDNSNVSRTISGSRRLVS